MDLDTYTEYDNPLIWPIITLLNGKPSGWMIHTLADSLRQQGILTTLDDDPDKDLFKRNFLLMNALYQLQEILLPEQWLQAQAMDICLTSNQGSVQNQIDTSDPLRSYYLDWRNYHIDAKAVKALLTSFWRRYQSHIGSSKAPISNSRSQDLEILKLPTEATPRQIRHQWRKLALRWHPDRPNGDAEQFRKVCEAWQRLQE